MARQATIYPYEMMDLLEELHQVRFTGTVTLQAGGTTTLYVHAGAVRYARTTRVMGAFPAYLLHQRVFTRDLLKRTLAACTEEGVTLERYLMRERVLSGEDLRHLKCDLARDIFAHSFCASGAVEIRAVARLTPEFKQPPMDPYAALFTCLSEHPSRTTVATLLAGAGGRVLDRGPEAFALLPAFRAVFGRSPVFARLGEGLTLDALVAGAADDLTDGGGDPRLPAPTTEVQARAEVLAQVFALVRTGMAALEGERPRRAVLRELRPEAPEQKGPEPADLEDSDPELAWRRRTPTRPGIPVRARGDDPLLARSPGLPPSPVRPPAGLERAASPAARAHAFAAQAERTPTGGDVGLRDILVGESLIAAAAEAQQQDRHAFFGIGPTAPLSALRAAYRRAWGQYATARFEGYALSTEAAAALIRIQEHIERAYDTLTDPELRREHDQGFGIDGFGDETLARMFAAEARFDEARSLLEARVAPEAAVLLREAARLSPDEPEYAAWLAWALVCATLWGAELPADLDEDPHELLDRALGLDGELPSAWTFIARIAELAGDPDAAVRAWHHVLGGDPGNAEAEAALIRLTPEGEGADAGEGWDEPATLTDSLVDRLDRILDTVR